MKQGAPFATAVDMMQDRERTLNWRPLVYNTFSDVGSNGHRGELVVEVRSSRGGGSGELEPQLEQFVREALAITLQAALARATRP